MLIKRRSIFTGVERELELNVTQDQIDAWQNGMLIQDAMPQLTPDEREFILTGVTAEEWDEALGDEE